MPFGIDKATLLRVAAVVRLYAQGITKWRLFCTTATIDLSLNRSSTSSRNWRMKGLRFGVSNMTQSALSVVLSRIERKTGGTVCGILVKAVC